MVVVCSGSLKADSNKADSNVRVPPFELKMVNTSLCQICAGARIALPTGKFLSEKKHKLRCGLQWERKIRLLMWDENIYRYPSLSLALKFSIQRPQVSQANVCSLTCQRYISFETHSTCLYLVVCFVFVEKCKHWRGKDEERLNQMSECESEPKFCLISWNFTSWLKCCVKYLSFWPYWALLTRK